MDRFWAGPTYPIFVIDGNAQFSETAHSSASDEIENIAVRHPSSPSGVVCSWPPWNSVRAI
jgi:hypothetical protein